MKCPFEIGQKVRHRGSGELAIVTKVHLSSIDGEPTGVLSISTGFQSNDLYADAHTVEADDTKTNPQLVGVEILPKKNQKP